MLSRLIDWTLDHRWLAILALAVLCVVGLYTVANIPVDAFPDLTNNQVVIITEARAMPPVEVEQLVTRPVELAMLGMPGQMEVRSISKLGLSMVTVVFEDSVDTYFARQLVNERLLQVAS